MIGADLGAIFELKTFHSQTASIELKLYESQFANASWMSCNSDLHILISIGY